MEETKTEQEEEKFVKPEEGGRSMVRMMSVFLVILVVASVGYFFRGPLEDLFEGFFAQ